ncbi:cobalt-precorrin-5B (C(1))-methyltransferase CbiD [Acaryochloris sp. IP29b_bin.137]|uniref:cobalt-precorrin-5B (C(1))-methyltransferase CbiD n=1 Tax=Acaryochloris sp. IP29b_bin.137 TaxID=2969217 RepID=UPI00262D9B7F|nr:cobalt-precorrin-5B (C(1))-methyltransferase CbiD [Acaryochloris sp. IP29b_bin.137]
MSNPPPRSGYTLPVFACAAAIAALQHLYDAKPRSQVTLNLVKPQQWVEIPIEQVSRLGPSQALAITRSDPGDNLDLTRHTPIWALVEWAAPDQAEPILLKGGEGIGFNQNQGNQPAIYRYAQQLLKQNLSHHLKSGDRIQVTLILPEGRALAARTSNAAFGIVEGLSLLGTSGISQPLSAPQQLEQFRSELRQKAADQKNLVFCVGENGLDIAHILGIPPEDQVKTANWLGPLLVEAGLHSVSSVLLLGYHGKLLKLAGGIFQTHHHLADARLEIMTAYAAKVGLPTPQLQSLLSKATAEAALQFLMNLDQQNHSGWVDKVYGAITEGIDARSQTYIQTHCDRTVQVGSALFNRNRQLFAISASGKTLLKHFVTTPQIDLNL